MVKGGGSIDNQKSECDIFSGLVCLLRYARVDFMGLKVQLFSTYITLSFSPSMTEP